MTALASSPSAPARAAPATTSPAPKTIETFDKAYANRIMLILAAIVMVVLYIEGMLTPSLGLIRQSFTPHPDIAQLTLIISAYAVAGIALSPVMGKLGDIYGKRKVLMGSMLTYAAAVSVTGFSPSFTFMVVARTVQGIGLTIMPLGMSLMREEFPRELVPKAQGLLSAMFGIGFAVSLPLGAFVSQTWGWRWTYHSAIPVVILLTVLVFVYVKESSYRRPEVKVDYPGAALLGTGLGLIVLALSQGQTWGWSSNATLASLILGLALMGPFVVWERFWSRRGNEPIVSPRLLAERNVAVTNVVLTIAGLGMYMALVALIDRFEMPTTNGIGFGLDVVQSGLGIVPLAVSMMVVAVAASFTVSRVGVKPLALTGVFVTSGGFYLLTFANSLTIALLYEVIVGAGIALLNASIINMLVLTVDPKDMGQATAMNNVFRNLGGSVGAPIVGSFLSTYTYSTVITSGPFIFTPLPKLVAFQDAFLIASVATLLGGMVVLLGQEVLGSRRHQKFAHLPTLPRHGRAPKPEGSAAVTRSPTSTAAD